MGRFNPFSYFVKRLIARESMRENKRLIFCPECTSMGAVDFHVCNVYKEGVCVRSTNKRWDPRLNCWVLDDRRTQYQKYLDEKRSEEKDVRRGNRYYDSKQNKWIDLDTGKEEAGPPALEPTASGGSEGSEGSEGYQTCELPKKEAHDPKCICNDCKSPSIRSHPDSCSCWNCWSWKKAKGLTTDSWAAFGNPHYGQHYVDVKPWDGVDIKKWPNTFMYLMGLYYINNRWYNGVTITGKEYQDRVLHGKYAPEPKQYYKKKHEDDELNYWRNWGPYEDYGES
jgi:hypothetical protein